MEENEEKKNSQDNENGEKDKNFNLTVVIIVLLAVVFLGAAGAYSYFSTNGKDEETTADPEISSSTMVTTENTTTFDLDSFLDSITEPTTTEPYFSDSAINEMKAYYISDGRLQCEDEEYTIFFGITDEDKEYIWIDATVDVKIVSDNDEVLFQDQFEVDKDSFGYYKSGLKSDMYLATINLTERDMEKGTTEYGSVILNVTGKNSGLLMFENYSISTTDLPYISVAESCSLQKPKLPLTLKSYNYNDELDYSVRIDDVEAKFEENYSDTIDLTITLIGEKTYGTNGYVWIRYELYDENDYVVESGSIMTDKLLSGTKFRNVQEKIRDLKPGKYRLALYEE